MKTRILSLIVLCILSLGSNNMLAQNDNKSLELIEVNTKTTADNTQKGGYEWFTIIISSLAFFVALRTYIVSRKTLASQKATQENTTPVFTREKQHEVFKALSERVIENYLEAGVVRVKMGTNPGIIPTKLFFPSFQLNSEELHMELFYDAKDDIIKTHEEKDVIFMYECSEYAMVSNLKSEIDQYNDMRKILISQIQQKKLDFNVIMQEYDSYIINSIITIIRLLTNTSNKIYKEKEDLRCHIVRYLWARKKIYTSPKEYPDLLLNEKELNSFQESLCAFTDVTQRDWNILFDGFDFSKAGIPEKLTNVEDLMSFMHIAIAGDKLKRYTKYPQYKYASKEQPA